MASTYSTDYQITLMATGEDAGTWGGITNDNLEKINVKVSDVIEGDAFSLKSHFQRSPLSQTETHKRNVANTI